MKNFLQVNRALAAEKNFYLNLNQLLTKLSNRLKTDGTSAECGCLWERISNHTLITQLSPNNHPINLPAIRYVATLLVVLMVGFGQAWGATTAPTGSSHTPGSVANANLVTKWGKKYEVYFSNNGSTSSLLVGSNTSATTQATGTDKWCNIGSGCGSSDNNVGTAFTVDEFVSNVKSSNNKTINIQSTAASEKNVVMVVSGYDSIAVFAKSNDISVYAEIWGGSSYGDASSLTLGHTKNASSHYKRQFALDKTKQYRLTIAFGTSGTSNKNLVAFSLCYTPSCSDITPTFSTDYESTTLTVGGGNSSTPAINKDGSSGAITWTSSDDAVATVDEDGVVTPVAAGSATITATIAAAGGKCEGSVSKNFTIKRNPLGSHTITWTMNVGKTDAARSILASSVDPSSTYITATQEPTVGSSSTKASDKGQNDRTSAVTGDNVGDSRGANSYVEFAFSIADGYQFTPSAVSVKVANVTTAKKYDLVLSDASNSKEYTFTSSKTDGSVETASWSSITGLVLTGNCKLRVYGYYASGTDGHRFGSPITISGTVAAESSCEELDAPTGLTYVDASYNTLSFSWDAVTNASSYDVKLWTNSSCTGDPAKSANTTNTTCRFRDLSSSTTYYCKVQTKGDGSTYCTSGGTTATAASGTTLSSTRTFKSGETVFFKDASSNIGTINCLWVVDGGNVYAYFYKDAGGDNWADGAGVVVRESHHYGNAIYKFTVPKTTGGDATEWDGVIFTRGTAATWGSGYYGQQTHNQSPNQGENLFTISTDDPTEGKYTGSWSVYANGAAIYGDMNNWVPDGGEFNYGGGSSIGTVYMNLAANTEYKFKVLDGTGAKGCPGTITNTTTSWWGFAEGDEDCTIRTGEEGSYAFKWDNAGTPKKTLGVYYPQARFAKNKYIYFDASNLSSSYWNKDPFSVKFVFKPYDNSSYEKYSVESSYSNVLEDHVYYAVVPDDDYLGFVRVDRWATDFGTRWNYADDAVASDRTSSKQNCMITKDADKAFWDGLDQEWKTYCPPTDVVTLSDNSTTVIAGTSGDGNKATPFLVETGGTINVTASADQLVDDDNMTQKFDFEVNKSSQQDGTGSTYSHSASTNNTVYKVTVKSYNYYNSTSGTKVTSDTLYYKALNVYTISYNKGSYGTEDNTTAEKIHGISKTLLGETFTRDGYTQTAWNTDPSGTGGTSYSLSGSYTANADITLYPTWTAQTYAITYKDQGGGAYSGSNSASLPATHTYGSATDLVNGVKSGYEFKGWFTDESCTESAGSSIGATAYTAAFTLYAKWAVLYTVTYDANGGSCKSSDEQASSGASITLATPTWSGYTPEGWYNSSGTKAANAGGSYTPGGNITLYAHWTDDISGKVFSFIDGNYGAKFKAFDLSGYVSSNATGKDKTYKNATTNVQFVIDDGAWDNKSNAIAALAKLVKGTTSMSVVIPTDTLATVKISYGAYADDKGNKYGPLTVGGSSQTAVSTALTDGMTNAQVIGAMKEITLNNQTGTLTLGSSSGNIFIGRVSAVISGYKVHYAKGANGTGDAIADDTKTHGSNLTLSSSTYTREGYTQDGWSTTDGGSKAYNLGGTYSTNAATTLYPHWAADTHDVDDHTLTNVTLSSGGATGSNKATYGTNYTATFAADDGYELPSDVTVSIGGSTKTKDTEYGWNSSTGVLTIYGSYITGDIAITVTGVAESCTPINASVTFDNNKSTKHNTAWVAGDISTSGSATYSLTNCSSDSGHKMTKPAIKGAKNSRLITITLPSGITSGNITVKACTYSGKTATLAIKDGDGTVLTSADVGLDGETQTYMINSPNGECWTDPTLKTISYDISTGGTYYIDVTDDNNNVYIFAFSATGTKTCPATTYSISTSATNGSIAVTDDEDNEIDEAAEGDEVTITATPSSGYSFSSWTVTKDAGGDVDVTSSTTSPTTFSMPGEDVTVSATFTPNTYDITYHLNGASWASSAGVASYTVGTGATLPLAGAMTNVGYTFDGWFADDDLETGGVKTEVGTSDYGNKEFWAKWTENSYTITYDANNGSATGSTSDTEGHYVTVADNGFELDGKTFYEWNTKTDGSGDSYLPGDEIELKDDLKLYAQWGKAVTSTLSVTKVDSKLYRGGGGYSVTVYLNQADWDAVAADANKLDLSATEGVTLKNIVKSINASGKAQIEADFDITTELDADATAITFTLSVLANNGYAAAALENDVDLDACSGGTLVWDFSTYTSADFTTSNAGTEGNKNAISSSTGSGTIYYFAGSGDAIKAAAKGKPVVLYLNGTVGSGSVGGNSTYTTRCFYIDITSNGTLTLTNNSDNNGAPSYQVTGATRPGTSGYSAVSAKGTGDDAYVYEITIDSYNASTANRIWVAYTSAKAYIDEITWTPSGVGGAGMITPTLTWTPALEYDGDWDTDHLVKEIGDADFTFTVTQDKNSLGAITYSSSNTSVATVNATTGKVHIVGAAGEATITATLAESGCYEEATAEYTITVTDNCEDVAGTIEATDLGCGSTEMTVSGHTGEGAGATYQWYKDGAEIGGATSATYTATAAGEYYVVVTNTGDGHCAMVSTNTIVVEAMSGKQATRLQTEWYVKNGRRTPDVALVQTGNAKKFIVKNGSTVLWDSSDENERTGFGGCGFYLGDDDIIYLKGTKENGSAPSDLSAGDVTLTIKTVYCDNAEKDNTVTIHCQAATDTKSIAFVVDGTKNGDWDAVTSGHADGSALYEYLDSVGTAASERRFVLTERNIYKTVNDSILREHYSQFDAILITDDPNTGTKDGKKSYVDAMGALIDIRPILTMEAYVSQLANWKAKGINGTPTSPNPRQYGMKLDCKNHEIFAGLNESSSNIETETIDGVTYWTVLMVDSTKSPYTGVAYNVDTKGDQKPALQGFEAEDVNGLMLLGEISEGTLFAGVERQDEPAARLLLLGVNAKALPNALTPEGKRVIANALSYLCKTNMEDVDDCSTYFTGKAGTTDWNTAGNWSKGVVPNSPMLKVRILKPCDLPTSTKVRIRHLDIVVGGKSKEIAGTPNGSLTIPASSAVVVAGTVNRVKAPYYGLDDLMPTEAEDLKIEADEDHTGALIFDNEKGDTKATVEMYSPSYWETVEGKKKKYWSYVGVPIQEVDIPNYFYLGFTYLYDETSGWIKKGDGSELHPFEGIGLSMQSGHTETFRGTLASTATKEITLTKTAEGGDGENLIGNSWTAPIQIANFDAEDFGDATATVYVYNTGRDAAEGGSYGGTGSTTAGQWVSVPVETAKGGAYDGLKVIPAMNAFQVNTTTETTLTLDYDKLVRKGASTNDLNDPMRAPRRQAAGTELEAMMRVRVSGTKTHTDVWLQQDSRFSEEFDNGWEAKYAECDNRSAQFYAQSEIGNMAFLALPDLEGTFLGFAPSRDGNGYTFTFHYVGDEAFYLNDLKLVQSTLISEEDSYSFTYEEGDTNRFYISRTRIDAPQTTTGVTNLDAAAPKAQKILYNDKVYIIRGGKVYSIDGALVK